MIHKFLIYSPLSPQDISIMILRKAERGSELFLKMMNVTSVTINIVLSIGLSNPRALFRKYHFQYYRLELLLNQAKNSFPYAVTKNAKFAKKLKLKPKFPLTKYNQWEDTN